MLLRVLETGDYRPLGAQVDAHSTARLIAATDQDLYTANFNQALLRRLENVVLHLPPLRTRREDIGVLILHLLTTINAPEPLVTTALSMPASVLPVSLISAIANYDWPGNIRQLKHVLQRIMLALQAGNIPDFAAVIQPVFSSSPQAIIHRSAALPIVLETHNLSERSPINPNIAPRPTENAPRLPRKKLQEITEQDVLQAMQNNRWTIQGAALELGISRPSMYKLIDEHSQIRRAEKIAPEEIRQTLASNAGDIDASAAVLKTPSEALRRVLKVIGMV